MTKHTPGPWKQIEYDSWFYIGGKEMDVIEYDPVNEPYNYHVEGAVCVVNQVDAMSEKDFANANLVTAAPDLLAACEMFVDVLTNSLGFSELDIAFQRAVAAIATVKEVKGVKINHD